jgi:hypothetical protein
MSPNNRNPDRASNSAEGKKIKGSLDTSPLPTPSGSRQAPFERSTYRVITIESEADDFAAAAKFFGVDL